MAQQDSHNVVVQSESVGGAASLVDDASNRNTSLGAADGTSKIDNAESTAPGVDVVVTPSQDTNSVTNAEHVPPKANAEPSAGNAIAEGSNPAVKSLIQEAERLEEHNSSSDSDAGNVDAKDGTQHNRTNSVKRPATFSKVSISKNFLAKSASLTPAVSRPGEKVTSATTTVPAAAKPRLVAKSASTLGSMTRSRNGTENQPGADAGTVWNKNRPAPAMPAKQFTDEELKQQYGIHLATRLQTDENIKGSKWADIDDEDDDWAPETVVWMDGTKSTLTPAGTPTVPILAKSPSPKPEDAPKPSLTATKKSGDTLGPIKTILRPGAAVQAKQQPGQTNATQLEKQTLKSKSPAPVPAKSPWATLPPVDKVSPINPPVQVPTQSQPQSFVSQDARNSDGAHSAYPAREIAADTFDRSWREGEGERRELFNSTNGKYEPAPEGRRNSIKFDTHGRKPVLSRGADTRATGEGYFGHRRGSSVSHASGPSARRLSYGRGSDSVVSADQPASTVVGHDMRQTPIGQQTPWTQQLPPMPPTGNDAEDPVKIQERVMREKREAARQRRQEEEAREEAAKKERLQAKLNALAGAGQSRREREQAAAESPAVKIAPKVETVEQANTQETSKVEQSDASPSTLDVSPQAQPREHISPSTASRSTFQSQASGSYRTTQTSAFSSPSDRERKLQPFTRSPVVPVNESFSPWPSAGANTNVWGVAGIGNGTFEGSSLFAPMSGLQQTTSLPPPPGMNRPLPTSRVSPQALGTSTQDEALAEQRTMQGTFANQSRVNGISPQGLGRQQHVPGPIGPPSRQQAAIGTRGDPASAWQSAAQRLSSQYSHDMEATDLQKQADSAQPRRNDVLKETFRQTSALPGKLGGPRAFERAEYSVHGGLDNRSASGPLPPSAQTQPSIDSWKQTSDSSVRLPDSSQYAAHSSRQPPIAPPSSATQSNYHSGKTHYTTAPLAPGPTVSDKSSPPPPETQSHPVFGEKDRVNIRLPPPSAVVKLPPAQGMTGITMPSRQAPWSAAMATQPLVKNGEWQARFNGLFNRTPIQTEIPPSPPRTPPKALAPVLAVASSSRPPLDDASLFSDATVSLPRASRAVWARPFVIDVSSSVTSKDMVQPMFNEELTHGDRPKVRVPRGYAALHVPSKIKSHTARELLVIDAQTQGDLPIFHLFYKKPGGFFIKLPGSSRNIYVAESPKHRKPLNNSVKPPRSRGPSGKKEIRAAAATAVAPSTTNSTTTSTAKKVTSKKATPEKPAAAHASSKKRSATKPGAKNPSVPAVSTIKAS